MQLRARQAELDFKEQVWSRALQASTQIPLYTLSKAQHSCTRVSDCEARVVLYVGLLILEYLLSRLIST